MDEARGDEATQSGQQQQCILSGEVYLRHRLKKQHLLFLSNVGLEHCSYCRQTPMYAITRMKGVQGP